MCRIYRSTRVTYTQVQGYSISPTTTTQWNDRFPSTSSWAHGVQVSQSPDRRNRLVPLAPRCEYSVPQYYLVLIICQHPEMICLQQGHIIKTKYGILGILAAVFWFPLGIGLCLLDKRTKCERCGLLIEDGCF